MAFIARDRLAGIHERSYAALAPDLLAEILSPDDRPGELLGTIAGWLEARTRLIWVIDARRKAVRVYRADGNETDLGEEETLDGEDVLPGFTCSVKDLLRR